MRIANLKSKTTKDVIVSARSRDHAIETVAKKYLAGCDWTWITFGDVTEIVDRTNDRRFKLSAGEYFANKTTIREVI